MVRSFFSATGVVNRSRSTSPVFADPYIFQMLYSPPLTPTLSTPAGAERELTAAFGRVLKGGK